MPNEINIINSVKYWIEKTIIGFNFCPFAKREFDNDKIHYEVVDDGNVAEQLHALVNEFQRLNNNESVETTIIIYLIGLESFFDYLDFLEVANQLLADEGYEGVYQLASFHPDYCFSDVKQDDPSNYTNRSPYPVIHIIREASLERVLAKYPNPELIPLKNIELARLKGEAFLEAILTESKKSKNEF